MTPDPQALPLPLPESGAAQGEGDYDATHRHRESVEAFIESGQVEDAARDAEPKTPIEEAELFEAERIGESHSKGEDPSLETTLPRTP